MSTNDKLADALQFAHDEFEDKRHVAQCRGDTVLAGYYERCRDRVAPALAAHATSLAAPPAQGEWVMVPREPTEAMRDAGNDGAAPYMVDAAKLWAQMLAASPQPAPAPVQVDEHDLVDPAIWPKQAAEIESWPKIDESKFHDIDTDAQPPSPGEAEVCDHAEVNKLVEFFRKEGYMRFGLNGDNMGWSPAETAIRAMREYMQKETAIASQLESRNAD